MSEIIIPDVSGACFMLIASAIVFFVLLVVATRIGQKALAALSAEDKVRLVDIATKKPSLGYMALAVVVFAWVAACYFLPQYATTATMACMLLILAMSAVSAAMMYRQFKAFGFPENFLRSYMTSRVLRLLGAGVFFTTMCLWLFREMAHHA